MLDLGSHPIVGHHGTVAAGSADCTEPRRAGMHTSEDEERSEHPESDAADLVAQLRQMAECMRELEDDSRRVRALEAEIDALRTENELLRSMAHADPLTGLANRRGFDGTLDREIARVRRHGHNLSLLLVDVDDLKRINDDFGHPVGDRVLCEVAAALHSTLRGGDLAARLGGDEFGVIVPETGGRRAQRLAVRIRDAIAARALPDGRPVTVSIGVAALRSEREAAADLLRRADGALYRAKSAGKNAVCSEDAMPNR